MFETPHTWRRWFACGAAGSGLPPFLLPLVWIFHRKEARSSCPLASGSSTLWVRVSVTQDPIFPSGQGRTQLRNI